MIDNLNSKADILKYISAKFYELCLAKAALSAIGNCDDFKLIKICHDHAEFLYDRIKECEN